jgi:hypothetical protein
MRSLLVLQLRHRLAVPGRAKVGLTMHGVAELLCEPVERRVRAQVSERVPRDKLTKIVVSKRDQYGRQVSHELMEGCRLRSDRLDVVGTHTVEDRMRELVIDDVRREAGIDGVRAVVEIVELQRFTFAVVERVLAVSGMGHDNQSIALESPRNSSAETEPAFEELQRALYYSPDVDLVRL